MNLKGRLDRLETSLPRRRVSLICTDIPPDGRTRVFYSDGTEAPPAIEGIDPDLVIGAKVFIGIDPDEI